MVVAKGFGDFFRAKRISLGLNQREFCRRNGYDAGNISRLERGLAAPSRSAEILDDYAKSLKLTPGSEDWHRFYEMAAAATGTVPPQIAEKWANRDALPAVFRTLRNSPRRVGAWTNTIDLQEWAKYMDARSQFPILIRRLIHATSNSLRQIEFAAGEGSERKGWDGLVDAVVGTEYVPAGLSVWELGVGREPARKTQMDLRKRRGNPLGANPSEVTYISVTPRRWPRKSDWEKKTNELGVWKKVCVYDADNLEAWLELAPAVDVWFARLIGKRTEGMVDADEYWKNLTALSEPGLKPGVFLTSRDEELKALDQWLLGPPSSLAIEARSPAEVIDFLAAHLARLDDAKRDSIASRVVIVESRAAWGVLADQAEALILAAKPGFALDAEDVAAAVRNGHHVLLCSERFSTGQSATLTLPGPYVYDLEKALQVSGFAGDEAARRARDCGGSLTVLKRRLSQFPSTTEPEWSRPAAAGDLAPLTLIGSWQETSTADQAIVARVSGRDYTQIAETVSRWSTSPDPPVIRVLGSWSLTSREDSWVLLARRLRTDQLQRWEESAIEVLTSDDATLDLDVARRAGLNAHGRKPTYSAALRGGIAESLALLASRPDEPGGNKASEAARARRIVRRVLGGSPGLQRWASLGRQLPMLAEAAPDEFLAAVNAELSEPESDIVRLLTTGRDEVFSRWMHAGLIWALETLAWNSSFLSPASLILARLAEVASGAQSSSSPARSLVRIFLPWLPQTAAGVEARTKALDRISERFPSAAWRLLLDLLSKIHGTSTPTRRPSWRDWTASWKRGVTNSDYWTQVAFCGNRLLEMAGADADRWADLIAHIAELPPNSRRDAMSRLAAIDVTEMTSDQRRRLTAGLRAQVRRNRAHPDAHWAIASEEALELERAIAHVEPDDQVTRNAWLFARWPELLNPYGDDWSLEEAERELAGRRRQALKDVLAVGGIPRILVLAAAAEDAWCVGFELATADLVDEAEVLPGLLAGATAPAVEFARGYARGRFESKGKGWDWAMSLSLEHWSAEQAASWAMALPAERRAWQLVERHGAGACDIYWKAITQIHDVHDPADIEHAVTKLLRQGRPLTAMHVLSMALHRKVQVRSGMFFDALEAVRPESEDDDLRGIAAGHSIEHIFRHLQTVDEKVDLARLARLEFIFLRLLDGPLAWPVTLRRTLASDPAYFADVLKLAFRSSHDTEMPVTETTDDEKRRAASAFELLHTWDTLPGFDEAANAVNATILHDWVATARRLCRESGHLEVCDYQIGELLSRAPNESDGSWPCVPVRDVIEETESEELTEGLVIGRLNTRDVCGKLPIEGGGQERSLAAQYVRSAEACEAEWPATAVALRRIAQDYEIEAGREDAAAEAHRLGRW
jgi:transcriptional regulator with XRE-family HTH domain